MNFCVHLQHLQTYNTKITNYHRYYQILMHLWHTFKLKLRFNWTLAVAGRVLWNRVCPSSRPPSVLPSRHFLGIVSLVFSKFWHGARNPYEVVRDRAGFSRKIFFAPKIGKMDPKWAKNRVFLIYWKIYSLIFTEFDL